MLIKILKKVYNGSNWNCLVNKQENNGNQSSLIKVIGLFVLNNNGF